MNKEKIAVIVVLEEDSYNSVYDVLFTDAYKMPNVYRVVEKAFPEYGIYTYLPSRKLQKLSFGLSNYLYLSYYNLSQKILELRKQYDKIEVLFHNAGVKKARYPESFFYLLRKYNVSFNMLYLDCYDHLHSCQEANRLGAAGMLDKVFSFDPEDAQKHGMEFHNTPYSKILECNAVEENQVYFCASVVERAYELYRVWQGAQKSNTRVVFDLTDCIQMKGFQEDPNVHCNSGFTSYIDILNRTIQSSCILDIAQKGQRGLSLRPYEAVVYNKKLLTNNKEILNFKYYNPKYMQYFEQAETIDWDWVKKQEKVDYKYSGDFSPCKLMEKLV